MLRHELLSLGSCIVCREGCLGVRAWVDRYTVFPCCVAVYESVFRLRDCAGKVAILLALFVMVGFCDREYPTELIFKLVNGLWSDHALRRVNLSRREISVSYAPLLLDVVMFASF